MKIPPVIRIIYLLIISITVFIFQNLYVILALILLQLLIWPIAKIPLRKLYALKRIRGFAIALLFFYSFFSGEKDIALLELFKYQLTASSDGFLMGLFMTSKLLTMLMTTFIVRFSMDSHQFISGLQKLKMPNDYALILDSMFSTLEPQKGGKNKDKKKEKNKNGKKTKATFTILQILKGNFSVASDLINEKLDIAKEKYGNNKIVIIASFSMAVSAIRMMKIAPGLPIAPGHKNVLIIPIFILGAYLTKGGFTATSIGFISGVFHFIMGFGKFGPFGLLEFVALGFVVDVLMKATKHSKSLVLFGFIGIIGGITRVIASITIALLLRMPKEFYMVYAPYILSQSLFGLLSAPISIYLINNIRLEKKNNKNLAKSKKNNKKKEESA